VERLPPAVDDNAAYVVGPHTNRYKCAGQASWA
jgi:hypothetical protein